MSFIFLLKKKLYFLFHNQLSKNVLTYTLGDGLIAGINFILIPIYTHYMPPDELGKISLIIILSTMIGVFVGCGLDAALAVKFYKTSFGQRCSILYNIIIFIVFMTLLVGFIFIKFRSPILRLLGLNIALIDCFFLILIVMFTLFVHLILTVCRMEQKAFQYVLVSISLTISIGIASIYCAAVLHLMYKTYIYAQLFSYALLSLWGLSYVLKNYNFSYFNLDFRLLKSLVNIGLPFVPGGIMAIVLGGSDRVIINKYFSLTEVGIYSVGYKFGNFINIFLVNPFRKGFDPFALKKGSESIENYKNLLIKLTIGYMITSMFVLFLYFIIIKQIFGIFVSSQYIDGYKVALIIAPTALINGVGLIWENIFFLMEQTSTIMYVTVFTGMLNVVLNFLFIPILGFLGAAYATLFSYLAQTTIIYFLSRKIIKISYPVQLITTICIITLLGLLILSLVDIMDTVIGMQAVLFKLLIVVTLSCFAVKILITQLKRYWNES